MSSKYKIDITWEDSDSDFEELGANSTELSDEKDFADLLARDNQTLEAKDIKIGDQVEATIIHIGKGGDIIVELGSKQPGVISKQELIDETSGNLLCTLGDKISAYVVAKNQDELILSRSMSNKIARDNALEDAYMQKIPVRGKITGVNKGGFEIQTMGRQAFCPVSALELGFIKDPHQFIGKEFDFLVTSLRGRDCVLSRRLLLEKQAAKTVENLRLALPKGEVVVDGQIIEIRDFGLLVDIGGIAGLVHISEAMWGHLDNLSSTFKVGEKVKVKVLSIEDKKEGTPRISLSIKQASADPWDRINEEFKVGESYMGRVVKLENFGAFVELAPGVDGLIHISEMSWLKRVHHPKDVLSLDERVSVRILDIDSLKRRISLSMKSLESDPWFEVDRYAVGSKHTGEVVALKNHGAILEIAEGISGRLPVEILRKVFGDAYRKKACPPNKLEVVVQECDRESRKLTFTLAELAEDDSKEQVDAAISAFNASSNNQASSKTGTLGEKLRLSLENAAKKA